uniref:Reelin domain-containing protein n=1 Tax=Varanus komodoensis TaxID=61221 RepID=A0A8D2IS72_VARKO
MDVPQVMIQKRPTVLSYPSGKINVACNSMLPRHGDSISQTSPPPYAISISSSSFTVGDEIVDIRCSKAWNGWSYMFHVNPLCIP